VSFVELYVIKSAMLSARDRGIC